MSNSVNQYWPVYRRLERSADDLTHCIHICDDQLNVYSSEIADLIIRIGAEIEAISKAIFRRDFDAQMHEGAKFDEVAIKRFVRDWKLDKKVAVLSHPNCFCSDRIFLPFVKDTTKTIGTGNRQTFLWNNAYQNLKHDREKSFSFANIRVLLSGLAALFILNLYYRDQVIELESDPNAVKVDPGQGSEFFSVQFSAAASWDGNHVRQPKKDFSECVYYVDREPEYEQKFIEAMDRINEANQRELLNSKDVLDAIASMTPEKASNPNWLKEAISPETRIAAMKAALRIAPLPKMDPKYQAFINRHQVPDVRSTT